MKKVMVFGTFDGLHKGHENFLSQAKCLGDILIVVVGRDSNVEKFKGSRPRQNEKSRLKMIGSIVIVDKAILGDVDHDYMKIIKTEAPEIICLGYDQHSFGLEESLTIGNINIEIIRLKPYKENKYKSSLINS